MSSHPTISRRILLNSRPVGAPTSDNFRFDEHTLHEPTSGQVLLRTLYLSLDPYMRGRMSDAPSYAAPVGIGEVMEGETVSRIVKSVHPDYQAGDLVLARSGWQSHAILNGDELTKLDKTMEQSSMALGVLGMPGFTAYMGLLDIGQPKSGETLVVAAASGPVGSAVGQIAKLKGCRVVGIAGGAEKCAYVVDTLGFDACIDHRSADFAQQLQRACSQGIDIYYENVGGAVFDAVLPLLNVMARIPVCGLVARYNDTELPQGPDRLGLLMRNILSKRLKMQGFIIRDYDYAPGYKAYVEQMKVWLSEGKVRFREDIVDGLDNAPAAFKGLLEGRNFGKLVIRVADE